jgi:SAM-dependent methyltransferase
MATPAGVVPASEVHTDVRFFRKEQVVSASLTVGSMTSKYTAHTKKHPSVAMAFLSKKGLLVGDMLDFGSGRGFDAEYYHMDMYDPNWLSLELPKKHYDTITCNWVLNVVTPAEQDIILKQIKNLLKPNGKAYITVRRDIEKDYMTKNNHPQRLVYLDLETVRATSRYQIYVIENTP